MIREIKYIGFYDLPEVYGQRLSSLAAINKMDYVAEAINVAGFNVHIISPSWSLDNVQKKDEFKGRTVQANPQKKITFCKTYATHNIITRSIKIVSSLIWLFIWLLRNAKRNEQIMVYHAPSLALPIVFAKQLVGFKLILEVEEIYGNVWKNSKLINKWEKKIIESADSYIAVSDVLAEILGTKVKAIVYGNYSLSQQSSSIPNNENDKINIVYAGSIDDTKGGAFKAVECAALLPENYIVHILGSGTVRMKDDLLKYIDFVNKKLKRNACLYHGVKIGKDYDDFLFKCQIALNTQKEGDYMITAFPSKVISYLSHNLKVISTRIKSIEKSKLCELITFSEDDQPENIVKSILSIDFKKPYDSATKIQELNKEFVITLEKLFDK
ncbi:MAG: hypothetical protein LLG05_08530 [Porphyromonadaceae bacterium]|nr:hypothetical protein [Porphyromonadaceae bacterium]